MMPLTNGRGHAPWVLLLYQRAAAAWKRWGRADPWSLLLLCVSRPHRLPEHIGTDHLRPASPCYEYYSGRLAASKEACSVRGCRIVGTVKVPRVPFAPAAPRAARPYSCVESRLGCALRLARSDS